MSLAEKKYDSGKLECRGLLCALKKLHFYLYGIRFLVEIDAKTLVYQLNQPASDLPGSVVNRWLVWIRLFDFDLKHVVGTKHSGLDALSRRSKGSDSENKGVIRELMKRHNTRNVPIAAYHSQLNGLIECGHQPIIDALAKLGPHWVEYLPVVL